MVKTFVLDSSVLIHSADSILSFEENIVVIPEVVIEEINSFLWEQGDLGKNAQKARVMINHLRSEGRLGEGVLLPNGGTLKVESNHVNQKLPSHWNPKEYDNRLFQVCMALKENGNEVILITKDILTRFKADILGIRTQDNEYELSCELNDQYQSRSEVFVSSSEIDDFFRKGYLNPERIKKQTDQLLLTPRRWPSKQREYNVKLRKLG